MVSVICAFEKTRYQFFSLRRPIFVYLVFMDLGLGISFIMMAINQARYLPRPLGKCENLSQLDNPDDGGNNWLDVLIHPEIPDKQFKNRLDVCSAETLLWKITIASV